jgi:hypothetical protein
LTRRRIRRKAVPGLVKYTTTNNLTVLYDRTLLSFALCTVEFFNTKVLHAFKVHYEFVEWLQIITSGGVTYKNEPWHRECFTCTNCNTSLAGQRFTSRDEKPYCAECFGELFAKRCTACSKPITGMMSTLLLLVALLWKLKACGCKVLKQACFQMLLFTGLRNRS